MDEVAAALSRVEQARERAARSRSAADADADAADREVIKAYEAGATLKQLAAAMGINSIEGARKVLLKHDVELRARGRRPGSPT